MLRESKGKIWQNDKRLRPFHFISQEPYIKWFWFMLHMGKRTISPKICLTPYLTNCNSYDCGFWYPCVKWWYLSYFELFFFHCFKILIFQLFQSLSTNVPPSSHVCDFSYILVFLKKIVCSENNEIFRINVYFSYQVGLLLVQQWVNWFWIWPW